MKDSTKRKIKSFLTYGLVIGAIALVLYIIFSPVDYIEDKSVDEDDDCDEIEDTDLED